MRTHIHLILASVLTMFAVPAAAQSGSYSFFGGGCTASTVPFYAPAVPRLGQRFAVESGVSDGEGCADGCTNYYVLTGDSSASFRGVPLPLDLTPFGLPTCGLLRVSVLHVARTQGSNARNLGEVVFPIPNDLGLLGVTFFQQVLVVSCGMCGCSRLLSRGGVGVIGR